MVAKKVRARPTFLPHEPLAIDHQPSTSLQILAFSWRENHFGGKLARSIGEAQDLAGWQLPKRLQPYRGEERGENESRIHHVSRHDRSLFGSNRFDPG